MTRSNSPRPLPSNPNLEQLKKQAKDLLSAYRAGEPDAIAQVQAHYRPRETGDFALHEAQLVIARTYGLETWPKLKQHIQSPVKIKLHDAAKNGDATTVREIINDH